MWRNEDMSQPSSLHFSQQQDPGVHLPLPVQGHFDHDTTVDSRPSTSQMTEQHSIYIKVIMVITKLKVNHEVNGQIMSP
jgi:hypothetical protein